VGDGILGLSTPHPNLQFTWWVQTLTTSAHSEILCTPQYMRGFAFYAVSQGNLSTDQGYRYYCNRAFAVFCCRCQVIFDIS
jgi:hypothetical protein